MLALCFSLEPELLILLKTLKDLLNDSLDRSTCNRNSVDSFDYYTVRDQGEDKEMVWIKDIVWVNWVWGRVGERIVVGMIVIFCVRVGDRISPPTRILPPIHLIHPQTYNISLIHQSPLPPHQNPHQTLTILDKLYHSSSRRNTKVLLSILSHK